MRKGLSKYLQEGQNLFRQLHSSESGLSPPATVFSAQVGSITDYLSYMASEIESARTVHQRAGITYHLVGFADEALRAGEFKIALRAYYIGRVHSSEHAKKQFQKYFREKDLEAKIRISDAQPDMYTIHVQRLGRLISKIAGAQINGLNMKGLNNIIMDEYRALKEMEKEGDATGIITSERCKLESTTAY